MTLLIIVLFIPPRLHLRHPLRSLVSNRMRNSKKSLISSPKTAPDSHQQRLFASPCSAPGLLTDVYERNSADDDETKLFCRIERKNIFTSTFCLSTYFSNARKNKNFYLKSFLLAASCEERFSGDVAHN